MTSYYGTPETRRKMQEESAQNALSQYYAQMKYGWFKTPQEIADANNNIARAKESLAQAGGTLYSPSQYEDMNSYTVGGDRVSGVAQLSPSGYNSWLKAQEPGRGLSVNLPGGGSYSRPTSVSQENSLAQIIQALTGRQVNAAPSVANGGVAYRPTMQSSAPNNFMSMLLGALIGGNGNMGGGFNPVLYGSQPQLQLPRGAMVARDGVGTISYPEGYAGPRYANLVEFEKAGGVYGSPQIPTRIPTFEEWLFQRTGGVIPTEPAIAQAETQARPTVPQTGPTVNGKTYYPSPIPGSQNPQTPAGTTPMMPMVQPYQRGSWQMPQLPQMWNPYGFGGFGGFRGFGGYMGSGNSGYQQPQVSGLSLFGGFKQPSMNSMSYFGGGR